MGKTTDGAIAGAGTGATIGMVGGPKGAAAGAVVGGVIGGIGGYFSGSGKSKYDPTRSNFDLPGYQGMQDRYGNMLGQGPRDAPQAGGSSFRGGQQQHINDMFAQYRGEGPGQEIARQQAGQQVDRGLGQQLAGARSARPGQSAMGARNAAMASGQLQGQGAQAATMGGLQAQQMAGQALGGALGQARGQDQSLAMGNANLRQQTMGLDDARQLELLRQSMRAAQMQQQGGQAYEGALMGNEQFNASQPTTLDRTLGAVQGVGQAYMQMKAGQNGGQPQQQYNNQPQSYGNLYGGYNPNQLQAGGSWQPQGYGSQSNQPGALGGSAPPSSFGGYTSGAASGFALPPL